MELEIVFDRLLQLPGRAMRAAPDLLFGQRRKPALDLVEPGSRSGREVNMKPRVASEPGLDRGRLVCAVVVHHQVDVQIGRHIRFDGAQELEELAAAMAPVQLTDDGARDDVQRGKQRRGAMTHVVVGAPLRNARGQRQDRLGAVERLDEYDHPT